jgi:hypothetical protein
LTSNFYQNADVAQEMIPSSGQLLPSLNVGPYVAAVMPIVFTIVSHLCGLDQEARGIAGRILEWLDEMLTVSRRGLPVRRSLAWTNSIENMMGTVRRVCRNVKRWRNAAMPLRWTAAAFNTSAYVSKLVEHRADAA